MIKKYQ